MDDWGYPHEETSMTSPQKRCHWGGSSRSWPAAAGESETMRLTLSCSLQDREDCLTPIFSITGSFLHLLKDDITLHVVLSPDAWRICLEDDRPQHAASTLNRNNLETNETCENRRDGSKYILVGGLEHVLFSHILGIIIPIDFHIFQRGGPTTNQILYDTMVWKININ